MDPDTLTPQEEKALSIWCRYYEWQRHRAMGASINHACCEAGIHVYHVRKCQAFEDKLAAETAMAGGGPVTVRAADIPNFDDTPY